MVFDALVPAGCKKLHQQVANICIKPSSANTSLLCVCLVLFVVVVCVATWLLFVAHMGGEQADRIREDLRYFEII